MPEKLPAAVRVTVTKVPPLVYGESRRTSPKSQVQVISRAAAVLRSLENEPDGLSLGGIAQRVGLPRSTVQRIVGALESESLLIAASPNGRVRLGPGLVRLSAGVETTAAAVIKPYMQSLAKEIGETVDLSTLARDHAVFVEQALGSHRIYAIAAIAVQFPLHCTANGKSMLALLNDEEILRRIGRSYERRTEHTLTSFEPLQTELQAIRRSGVAYSVEENALGVCAIGVGFRDRLGNIMALSVPIPTPRYKGLKSLTSERLLTMKALIQARLGAV
jgi:DNA-binding IclR family transcriptional regulator